MKTVLVRRDQNHVSFCFFSNFDEKGIFLLLPRGFLFFCFFFAESTCSGKLISFVSRRISGNFSASIFLAACICPLRDAIRVASSVEQTVLCTPSNGRTQPALLVGTTQESNQILWLRPGKCLVRRGRECWKLHSEGRRKQTSSLAHSDTPLFHPP